MSNVARNRIKARTVRIQAWWLALNVEVHGWNWADQLTVDGIALAWKDCGGVMGVS